MNEIERAVSIAVNKALSRALPDIGKTIGTTVAGEVKIIIAQHIETTNAKFEEVNSCLNAIIQTNVSFFGLLCSINPEFRESLCSYLQGPPNDGFADNQYYNQILEFWRDNLQVTSSNVRRQDSNKSHLKLVIGNRPSHHENLGEKP